MIALRFCLFALLAFGLTACGQSSPLPDMQPGEEGRVVRIIDGDALILNTGQSVRLVSVEAPVLRPRNREPDPYAIEASRTLENMVMGRQVRLYYPGLTRDRYDRALAHVVTIDQTGPVLWVNMELVKRGAARVRLYPDTAARGEALLVAEAQARAEKTGLWGKSAYSIMPVDQLAEGLRGFTLVSAVLGPASAATGDFADNLACQRRLEGTDLRLEVRLEAADVCERAVDEAVILRGWISGDRLDLTHPLHIQAAAR